MLKVTLVDLLFVEKRSIFLCYVLTFSFVSEYLIFCDIVSAICNGGTNDVRTDFNETIFLIKQTFLWIRIFFH